MREQLMSNQIKIDTDNLVKACGWPKPGLQLKPSMFSIANQAWATHKPGLQLKKTIELVVIGVFLGGDGVFKVELVFLYLFISDLTASPKKIVFRNIIYQNTLYICV